LIPGQSFIETKRELEAVIADLKADDPDLRAEVHFYLTGNGYELERESAVIMAMERAHHAVYGEPIPYAAPSRYAVSSDAGPMFEYGIKGLTYGPGGVSATGSFTVYDPSQQQSEVLSIENLVRAAKVYALAALDLCGSDSDT
jgi:acetylornithine deacetylase/succinyl-diaminopimelate desuccinylase-like protein